MSASETTVLLVEDSPGDAELLTIRLEESPDDRFHLTTVARLYDALEVLETTPFDVIVLDLSLPDSHGLETLDRLRGAAPIPAIVVMTGNADEALSLEAARQGADAYLRKDEAEGPLLVRTIRYAIQRRLQVLQLEEQRSDAEHRATHDALTGAPNRMLFADRLTQALHGAFRTGRFVGLIFLDVDHFKHLNDTHGHSAGDALLRHTADRLSQKVRSSDTVARIGGDEFVVLLTNVKRAADVELVASKLHSAVCQPIEIEGKTYQPSVSLGVAVSPRDGRTEAELFAAADTAMYRVKRTHGGRRTVRFETGPSGLRSGEPDVAAALDKEELRLRYALRAPRGEENGRALEVIPDLRSKSRGPAWAGRSLLRIACEQGVAGDLMAAVLENLSRDLESSDALRSVAQLGIPLANEQLCDPHLVEQFSRLRPGVPVPLELVVPIDRIDASPSGVVDALAGLKDAPVSIALEHGPRVDRLVRALRHLRPDSLRLCSEETTLEADRSLHDALIAAFAACAKHLELPWEASGVSEQTQAARLFEIGCLRIQGPVLGDGVEVHGLEEMLACPPPWRTESAA